MENDVGEGAPISTKEDFKCREFGDTLYGLQAISSLFAVAVATISVGVPEPCCLNLVGGGGGGVMQLHLQTVLVV